MTGFAIMVGPCFVCGQIFGYNPHRVPSIPIDRTTGQPKPVAEGGVREPICRECVEEANPLRKANGLEEIVIYEDSYEPIEESCI